MTPLAFYRDLIANGVPEDLAYRMAEKFEAERAAEVQAYVDQLLDRLAVDRKAEARRAKDRARKAAKARGIPRNSAESAESAENTRPLPSSPQTPQQPTPTRVSVTSREREATGDFERFWTAYPRKDAKATARKKFTQALAKAPVETMLAAVERQRTWEQWQRGFIPHAATWLHQERWNDEEPPNPQPTPRKAHERPHSDDKFDRRQANLARAFAASERVAGQRWEP